MTLHTKNFDEMSYELVYKVIKDADIPAVEAVIALLSPTVQRWWILAMAAAIDECLVKLGKLEDGKSLTSVDLLIGRTPEDRKKLMEMLLISLLIIFERHSLSSSPNVERLTGLSVDKLLSEGAASVNLPLTARGLLPMAAILELQTMLSGRVALNTAAIAGLFQAWLTTASLRVVVPGLEKNLLPREGGPPRVHGEWRSDLEDVIGSSLPERWIKPVIDQWAYRWFTVGAFQAGKEDGIQVYEVVNPDDDRTTSFCRWVNGRRVGRAQVDAQIRAQVAAAMDGEIKDLVRNWPMMPGDMGRTGSVEDFADFFERAGAPPYHWGCRSRLVPVR